MLFRSGKTRRVGIFHYGYPWEENLTLKEKVKQAIYETSWRGSNWEKLLFVNPVVYESMAKKHAALSSRIALLPDPVPPKLEIDSLEARQRLGIPLDGVYIGFVGMMDQRKAIPELLAAFVNANAFKSSRLLLAGLLAEEYFQLINEKYSSLIKNQSIILINRHLTNEEIQFGYQAIDVHALLQYRRMNLSANLLKAATYHKPVIVDDCGYTGMMAKRFNLGITCDVNNLDSVSEAIKKSIQIAPSFKSSAQTNRLIAFHHPDNYANTIMNESIGNKNHAQNFEVKTWDWVCEGVVI